MALPASDNFNRANSANLGTNWTAQVNTIKISSNQATGNTSSDNAEFWNADAFANDHYSQVTIATVIDGGPTVRASSTNNYYTVEVKTGTGTSNIGKLVGGVATVLQTLSGVSFANGSVVKLVASGSILQAFKNGVQVGTNQSDGSLSSGSAGLDTFALGTIFDDWSADNLGIGAAQQIPAMTQAQVGGALTGQMWQ